MTKLAALAHLGPRGRRLAALVSEHSRRGAARAFGVSADDIDAVVRLANAMEQAEPIQPRRRDYVEVRRLKPAEVRGLAILVSDLMRGMGLRPLARRLQCADRTVLLYARGCMTRTAPMLAVLAPVLGQRDATSLLSLASAVGYVPVPVDSRKRRPPNAGLHSVDVKPRGASGVLVIACVRAGATALEIAAYLEVPVADIHAAVHGAGLPQECHTRMGFMLERLTLAMVEGVE